MWNLRLNKTKSQVLTEENIPDIAGIPCATHVKYLGVPVHIYQKAQREKCVASIKRNLGHLKWKLRKVDLNIKETLTCVLARSILVYIGTPMVAAGLWKRISTAWKRSSSGRSTAFPTSLVTRLS